MLFGFQCFFIMLFFRFCKVNKKNDFWIWSRDKLNDCCIVILELQGGRVLWFKEQNFPCQANRANAAKKKSKLNQDVWYVVSNAWQRWCQMMILVLGWPNPRTSRTITCLKWFSPKRNGHIVQTSSLSSPLPLTLKPSASKGTMPLPIAIRQLPEGRHFASCWVDPGRWKEILMILCYANEVGFEAVLS